MALLVKRILKYWVNIFKNNILYHFQKKYSLIILDNFYPHLLSGFRTAEFNFYLERFENTRAYTSGTAFSLLEKDGNFEKVKGTFSKQYPANASKIVQFTGQRLKAKLCCSLFLDNTFNFLHVIERDKIPFMFTLYPGGGFLLNDKESNEKLRKILGSTFFRKVIVTTIVTKNYLLEKGFCSEDKIIFIYGVVTPVYKVQDDVSVFSKGSEQALNICFVAHKYMEQGRDKGYDVLIEVAQILKASDSNILFHVVGNFNEMDIDVSNLSDRIHFHGQIANQKLSEFYKDMDIILSPNSSNVLRKGAFDGFPTGSCIEAGLNGVAIFATDDLNQNIYFEDKKDILIISKEPAEIAEKILEYHRDRLSLKEIAVNGCLKIKSLYNSDAQLEPRLMEIKRIIATTV